MQLGLVARADDRGLGHLTHDFYRAMSPAKTLVIDMLDPAFPTHYEWYGDDAAVISYKHSPPHLPELACREWLEGLDVVYMAETAYEWHFIGWAREMGVRTVIHGMPELTEHARPESIRPHPDQWLWPTPWVFDNLPAGRLLEIPAPELMRTPYPAYSGGEPLRVLHHGGRAALRDRDGTILFIEALGFVKSKVHVTITSQDGVLPRDLPRKPNLSYDVWPGLPGRFDAYADQHLMVMPRRYGGLSLKVHEALSQGVPVLLPDINPNQIWPGIRVPAKKGPNVHVPFGFMPTFEASPRVIAQEIDRVAGNPEIHRDEQYEALAWTVEHSWQRLEPAYRRVLAP